MLSPLSRAVLLEPVRRGLEGARRAPLLALLVGLPALCAPAGAVHLGRELATGLDLATFQSTAFCLNVAGSVFVACMMVGVAAAAMGPSLASFDQQVLAAPVSRVRFLVQAVVLPLALPLTVVAGMAGCVLVPLALSSPAGLRVALTLALVAVAGVATGSTGSWVLRGALSPLATAGLIVLWISLWVLAGTAEPSSLSAGTIAAGAAALQGNRTAILLLGGADLAFLALGLPTWLRAARGTRRASWLSTGSARSSSRNIRVGPVLLVQTAVVLVRRSDVRSSILGVLVVTPVGLILSRTFALLPDLTTYLISLVAVIGNATVLLAVPRHVLNGRWLVATAPRLTLGTVIQTLLGGVLVYFLAVAAGLLVPVVLLDLPVSAARAVLLAALVVSAAALAAGTVCPWSADNATQQAVSGTVFIAVLVLAYLGGTRIASASIRAGMDEQVVAVVGPVLLLTATVVGCGLAMTPRTLRALVTS